MRFSRWNCQRGVKHYSERNFHLLVFCCAAGSPHRQCADIPWYTWLWDQFSRQTNIIGHHSDLENPSLQPQLFFQGDVHITLIILTPLYNWIFQKCVIDGPNMETKPIIKLRVSQDLMNPRWVNSTIYKFSVMGNHRAMNEWVVDLCFLVWWVT